MRQEESSLYASTLSEPSFYRVPRRGRSSVDATGASLRARDSASDNRQAPDSNPETPLPVGRHEDE